MIRFIFNRLVTSMITLLVIVTITFALMHAIPGGPLTREREIPPEIRKNIEEKYHLDEPLWKQYIIYLHNLIQGDLGPSLKYPGVTVNEIIARGFPVTAQLGLQTMALLLLAGIPAGVYAALKEKKWQDHLIIFISTALISIPNFLLAILLIYIFGVKLGWLPTSRWVSWKSSILPSLALAGYTAAYLALLTRYSILEVVRQDYIRVARAKGLPEAVVIYKHALKNALIPIVTYLGPVLAYILTGSFVIERIFAIPGLGQYYVISISNRDYTLILGMTLFYAAFIVSINLLVDIVYCFIDPRIRIMNKEVSRLYGNPNHP